MRSSVCKAAFVICSCILSQTYGQTIAQINTLSSSLLSGYNKHTRPTNTYNSAVTVYTSFAFISLRDFDEVQEKFSTVILFDLEWFDESLSWDPATNNNIDDLTFSQNDVWKPLLTLSNPHGELNELGNKDWVTVKVNSTGFVEWSPLSSLDTTCSINTKYYPYDSQSCSLQMYTFGYSHGEVDINVIQSTLDFTYYEGHATWKITSSNVVYQSTIGGAKFLYINVNLERQPTFIIVNFLIPIFVLAVLNPLVFLLPIDSGERLGFSITILLSLSVFLTILGDYIPQNSNPMSRCAFMLMSLYICSSVILLLVIVSSNIYLTNETKPVNMYLKAFVRIFSCQRCKRNRVIDDNNARVINASNGPGLKMNPEKDDNETMKVEGVSSDHVSWKDVSGAMDKLCFVSMYIIVLLVIIIFVSLMKN